MSGAVVAVAVLVVLSGGTAGAFIVGRRHAQPQTPQDGWLSWDDDDENDPWTD